MKPEAQRIAIAEACGHIHTAHELLAPDRWAIWYADVVHLLPDYLNDLNAMHEAEKVLDAEQARQYDKELQRIGFRERLAGAFWLWHMTAAWKAEAFLSTIGKWEEAA